MNHFPGEAGQFGSPALPLVLFLAYSAKATASAAKAGRPNHNLPAVRLEGLPAILLAG